MPVPQPVPQPAVGIIGVIADAADRRIAHRGTVRIVELAVFDFLHAREAFGHDGHVRGHDGIAEAAEFLLVLLFDGRVELFLGNVDCA